MKTRIVKLQKNLFKVEFFMTRFDEKEGLVERWIEVERNFTSHTKAEEFIREKFDNYFRNTYMK